MATSAPMPRRRSHHSSSSRSSGLRWYELSAGVRRGFCGTCGASLFWESAEAPTVSIAAGTLDGPTGLVTIGHIYVADAGDYYAITDDLPRFPGTDGGALDRA